MLVPPLTGSLSTSIELRALIADRAERRFRCSGGRLRGCVSGSIFFRREDEPEPGSVAWRAKLREVRGGLVASRDDDDESGRCDFTDEVRDVDVEGAVGGPGGSGLLGGWDDLVGEGGCVSVKTSGSSSSSSTELGFLELFLEKNFIEVDWGEP